VIATCAKSTRNITEYSGELDNSEKQKLMRDFVGLHVHCRQHRAEKYISWHIGIFPCPLVDMFSNANSHQQKERKMEKEGKTERGTQKGRTRESERERGRW